MMRFMRKNKSVLRSFGHAFEGLWYALRHERNLRFHLVITSLITLFGWGYGLERHEWGMLVLSILFVILSELVNSAVEYAVDTASSEWSKTAKAAKDAAAAVPLTAAVGSLIEGCVLFLDPPRIWAALVKLFTTPASFAIGAVLVIGGTIFIVKGGAKDDD